jgi:hypothetical protein
MPKLTVQVQPELAPALDFDALADLFSDAADVADAELSISAGEDDGPFVNYDFLATNLGRLWDILKDEVIGDSAQGALIANASIVLCEGKRGWDDYLLLHHYDRSEKLDWLSPD